MDWIASRERSDSLLKKTERKAWKFREGDQHVETRIAAAVMAMTVRQGDRRRLEAMAGLIYT